MWAEAGAAWKVEALYFWAFTPLRHPSAEPADEITVYTGLTGLGYAGDSGEEGRIWSTGSTTIYYGRIQLHTMVAHIMYYAATVADCAQFCGFLVQ